MRLLSKQERKSLVAQIIRSLPRGAGSALKTLNLEIPFCQQERPCEWCSVVFLPKDTKGVARFCSRSCSAKWRMSQTQYVAKCQTPEARAKRGAKKAAWFRSGSPKAVKELARIAALNPMSNPAVRAKVSAILKKMKHRPSVPGGNGTGLTVPQMILLDALGPDWKAEYPLRLGKREAGYPASYKLDLANVEMKVCIEVDGPSHYSRKAKDAKRDAKVTSLGWKVLRFWNKDILSWNDSGRPTESYISTTLKQNGINLTQ